MRHDLFLAGLLVLTPLAAADLVPVSQLRSISGIATGYPRTTYSYEDPGDLSMSYYWGGNPIYGHAGITEHSGIGPTSIFATDDAYAYAGNLVSQSSCSGLFTSDFYVDSPTSFHFLVNLDGTEGWPYSGYVARHVKLASTDGSQIVYEIGSIDEPLPAGTGHQSAEIFGVFSPGYYTLTSEFYLETFANSPAGTATEHSDISLTVASPSVLAPFVSACFALRRRRRQK